MNITTIHGLELRPLVIPSSIDSPDAADFITMVGVRNRVYAEVAGHGDDAITPGELLPHFQPVEHEKRIMWLIVLDGVTVGRASVDLPQIDGSKNAFWLVEILDEAAGRGIGSAAYALVEQTARAHGRTVLQSWAQHSAADGPRLEAPTGFGSIPDDRAAKFYQRHGYSLEQIERNSVLDLQAPFDEIERLYAQAQEASRDYRVVHWFAPTPPEYVDGYAWLKSRMSTDAPAAGLEFDEETWDAKRIANLDGLYTTAGRTRRVSAAQHIASGELCAFNELVVGVDKTEASQQEDTLVLKGHRGHRLGMLVKCENLLAWREIAPESPRMITYNAEENRPMLDINEAIGFVPLAYEGAWKKVLS